MVCRYKFDHLPHHLGTSIHVWIVFVKNGSNCRNVAVPVASLSVDVLVAQAGWWFPDVLPFFL